MSVRMHPVFAYQARDFLRTVDIEVGERMRAVLADDRRSVYERVDIAMAFLLDHVRGTTVLADAADYDANHPPEETTYAEESSHAAHE